MLILYLEKKIGKKLLLIFIEKKKLNKLISQNLNNRNKKKNKKS